MYEESRTVLIEKVLLLSLFFCLPFTSMGYFNLTELKVPIFPNFQKISRILKGSICPNIQMKETPIRPNFGLIC